MKAVPFEYRFRYALHALLYFCGFAFYWLPSQRDPSWLMLTPLLIKLRIFNFTSASVTLLIAGTICAIVGAWLRTYGSAFLGAGIVESRDMHGEGVLSDGPYRYVRNPLYLGTFLHTLALALLMPMYGAAFVVVALALFQLRLIFTEEPFLAAKLGEPYREYCRRVPRLLPSLRPRTASSDAHPQWLQAVLGESYMIGVALSFAAFDVLYVAGKLYNPFILTQCVLVSFGVSLVLRAINPKRPTQAAQ
jgi:protein-S-isoprenylcysteine O-methyltransferase Ste14